MKMTPKALAIASIVAAAATGTGAAAQTYGQAYQTYQQQYSTYQSQQAAYNAARFDMGVKYAVGDQTFLFANGGAELSDRGQTIGGTVGLRFVW